MSEKAGTAMTIVQIQLDLVEMIENFSIDLRLSKIKLGSCWMRENLEEFSDGTGPRAAECCQALLACSSTPYRARIP